MSILHAPETFNRDGWGSYRQLLHTYKLTHLHIHVSCCRREFGLERFVPVSLMETMKRKELRKIIGHFLKMNQNMTTASGLGHKSLTSLQAKLYYLNIISQLPSYGAKCFSTNIRVSDWRPHCALPLKLHRQTQFANDLYNIPSVPDLFVYYLQDSNMETVILVSPKFGISQIVGMRNSLVSTL